MELGYFLRRFLAERAKDNPVGVEEVGQSIALAQEFGVGHHGEVDRLRLGARDDVGDPVAGAHGNRALVDDDQRLGHGAGDLLGCHAHVAEVRLAIHTGRGADRNEDKASVTQAFAIRSCKRKAPGTHVALDHFLQTGLVDRHLAGLEHGDLLFIDIHTDYGVPQIGKAGAGH